MAHVHPQRDVRVLAVAAEVPLADDGTADDVLGQIAQLPTRPINHAPNCFTVRKNVKRWVHVPVAGGRRQICFTVMKNVKH